MTFQFVFNLSVFILLIVRGKASLSLLGIKSKQFKSSATGDHASGTNDDVATSFAIDTSLKDMTRLYGKGLRFQVDSLEVAGLDGLFKVTDSNLRFEKAGSVWKTTVEENTMGSYHNDKNVMLLNILPNEIEESKFRFVGDGMFHDIWLSDREKTRDILVNLCKTDRILSPLPVGVIDKVANSNAVERCGADMASTELTMASIEEYISKLMVTGAKLQVDTTDSLAQLQSLVSSLSVADKNASAERSATEERERVKVIMTEFEAVVDALRKELTSKFKGVSTTVDSLQAQWGSVGNQVEALGLDVSAWKSRITPVEDAMRTFPLEFAAQSLALNASICNRLAELESSLSAQYSFLNTSIQKIAEEVHYAFSESIANYTEAATALADMEAEQALLRESVSIHVNTTKRQLQSFTEAGLDRLNISVVNVVNRTDSLQSELFELGAQRQRHDEAIFSLQQAIPVLNESISDLSQRVTDNWSGLHQRLNSSVTALQKEITAEFSSGSRALREAHVELSTANAKLESRIGELAAYAEMSLLGNVSQLTNITTALVQEQRVALLHQILHHAEASAAEWNKMNASVVLLTEQVKMDVLNVSRTHWEAATAAVEELTANTSNVVARSNSILAKAIGEVNSSVLLLAESLSADVFDLRAEVLLNASTVNSALRSDFAHQIENISADFAISLNQLRQYNEDNIHNRTDLLSSRLKHLDDRVAKDAESIAVETATDRAETRRLLKTLNSTILTNMDHLQSTLAVQHNLLNESFVNALDILDHRLRSNDVAVRALLDGEVASLQVNFTTDLLVQKSNFSLHLSQLREETESALMASSDQLRHQLLALNVSVDKARSEDILQLEASLAGLRSADLSAEQALHGAILNISDNLSAAEGRFNSSLLSLETAVTANLQRVSVDMAVQLLNQSTRHEGQIDRLHHLIDNSTAQLAESLGRSVVQQATAHESLLQEMRTVRAEAQNGSSLAQKVANDQLQMAITQLKEYSAMQGASVAAAANSSLHVAFSSLRSEHDRSEASLRLEIMSNFSHTRSSLNALNGSLLAMARDFEDRLIDGAIATHRNLSVLSTKVEHTSAETNKRLSSVNTSLSSALDQMRKSQLSDNEGLSAQITATALSLHNSNDTLHRRIDAVHAALVESSQATSSQFTLQAQISETRAEAANAALSSQWKRTSDLAEAVGAQASRNISAVNASLSRALQDGDAALQLALATQGRNLSHRIDAVEKTVDALHKATHADFNATILSLNASTAASLNDVSAKHMALVFKTQQATNRRDMLQNRTEAALANLSSGIEGLKGDLTIQAHRLNSSLSDFKVKLAADQEVLMKQVEERVRAAEVQQLLGAVAVQAVVNNTQRLSRAVDDAGAKISALDVQTASLHVRVDSFEKQSRMFGEYYTNFTSGVLPQVHSSLGSLQQKSLDLDASVKALDSDLTATKSELGSVRHDLRSLQTTFDDRSGEVAASLALTDKRVTDAVDRLQSRYMDVAVASNTTSGALSRLERTVDALGENVQALSAQQVTLIDATRRVSALEANQATATDATQALEQRSEAAVRALRDVIDSQATQLASLGGVVKRQQEELEYLQGENRRLLRETASIASVDELRKLLFEMQNQMISHSGKVLDLLLQPR